MHSKKGFFIPLIITIVAILTLGGVYFYKTSNVKICAGLDDIARSLCEANNKGETLGIDGFRPKNPNETSTATTTIVGGDWDEHGCLGSAGYSWCEVKNKCLRVWEEKCENINDKTITKDLSLQETNLSWNLSNIMLLNSMYDVVAETNIPIYTQYMVYPKNSFIDRKIVVNREGFFKFLLYSQNKEQRKIIIDKGMTLEENTKKSMLDEDLTEDKNISYNNCEFFKKFYSDFGYKITGLCDDGNNFMLFSSQASTKEAAYSMIKEIMKVIEI